MNVRFNSRMARAGFTMVELMFSVLVLGLLLGLLIVGARSATRYAKKTSDEQTVRNLAQGVKEFKRQFGFVPPLVKEVAYTGATPSPDELPMRTQTGGDGVLINTIPATAEAPARYQIAVYNPSVAADFDKLQNDGVTFNPTQALLDERYSVRSLAVYLAGGLNSPFSPSQPATDFIPIDGVKGPGFFTPRVTGLFDVPGGILGGANSSKRANHHEPLVNLGGSAIKLYQGTRREQVSLVDRNNIHIRYYRWENFKPGPSDPVDSLLDLRIPTIVGRVPDRPVQFPWRTPPARDLEQNIELRAATWAIVAAGGNKVFGDEPIDYLRRELGMNSQSEEEVREAAEEDNIVEVGS